MSRKEDIDKILAIKQRRLQILKMQEAKFGINTPPHILMEIEDAESEINKLQAELDASISGYKASDTTLSERIRELEGPLATYNRRINALRKDLALEMDGERRAILEERLREVTVQRDKIQSEIESIKWQLDQ